MSTDNYKICPICSGNGLAMISFVGKTICPHCGGTGKVPVYNKLPLTEEVVDFKKEVAKKWGGGS